MPVYCLPQPELQSEASYDVYTSFLFAVETATVLTAPRGMWFFSLIFYSIKSAPFSSEGVDFHGSRCPAGTIVLVEFGEG